MVPQTLVALWHHLQDIRKANDGDIAHPGSISGKLDLEMGRIVEGTDGKKNGERIVDEQAVLHVFDCWFLLSDEKPIGVGKLVQRVHVYVGHRKSFHL